MRFGMHGLLLGYRVKVVFGDLPDDLDQFGIWLLSVLSVFLSQT